MTEWWGWHDRNHLTLFQAERGKDDVMGEDMTGAEAFLSPLEQAALACVRAVDAAFDRSERLRVGRDLLPRERELTIARIVAEHMTAYTDTALAEKTRECENGRHAREFCELVEAERDDIAAERDAALARCAALEEGLRIYGVHGYSCACLHRETDLGAGGACDCGLDALLTTERAS